MAKKIHDGGSGNYLHYCPGCEGLHMINTGSRNQNNALWSFNGNFEVPTFTPSVDVNKNFPESRCHYSIIEGKIIFTTECYHKLAGQTIDIPEIPDDWL